MKTKIIYRTIVLLLISFAVETRLIASLPAASRDVQNEYIQAWNGETANQQFVYQSELFYSQNMVLNNFSGGDFLTSKFGSLQLGFGNDEIIGDGGATKNDDHIYLANDVPLGDGVLPLLLAAFGWIAIVIFRIRIYKMIKFSELNYRIDRIKKFC